MTPGPPNSPVAPGPGSLLPHGPVRRLLFVCLGNICRSPAAEGLFLHLARQRGPHARFAVDSCGLGDWHVGSRPDPRTLAVAAAHGVDLPSIARTFDRSTDPRSFDLYLAMDRSNLEGLLAHGCEPGRVRLMRAFEPGRGGDPSTAPDVPDPYLGETADFHRVHAILTEACGGLLDRLLAHPA